MPNNGRLARELTLISPQLLQLAEGSFGKRDSRFRILEFRIVEQSFSNIFFKDDHTVFIQLGNNCINDPELAHFQLAHETVHLLSPVKGELTTVLEEGLATRFGCDYMVNHYPNPAGDWRSTGSEEYNGAKVLADKLLSISPSAIRCLRETQQTISEIDLKTIRTKFPALSQDDAEELCMPFKEWKNKKGLA